PAQHRALPGRQHPAAAGRLGSVAWRRRPAPVRPDRRAPGTMRRLAVTSLLTIGLAGAAVFGVGAASSGGGSGYEVRAIFDDAASAVPGEDVRVAGAKVGSIGKMEVTPQRQAAVQLKID